MSELYRFELMWADEAAGLLRADQGSANAVQYLNGVLTSVQREPLFVKISSVAAEIEPYDPATGFDDDFPAANAFVRGAAPAIRLAQRYLQTAQREDMFAYDLDIETCNNEADPRFAEIQEASNREHMKLAADGREIAGPALWALLDEWEDEICPDVTKQVYFRNGFGFVIYLASQTHKLNAHLEIGELAQQVESGKFDWDLELARLVAPDGLPELPKDE